MAESIREAVQENTQKRDAAERAVEDNTLRLEAVELVIQFAQESTAPSAVRHQAGSFASEVTSAVREMLAAGPMHRRDILSRLQERGIEFMGRTDPMRVLANFLSRDETTRSVGKGMWDLIDRPMPAQTDEERRMAA